MDNNIRREIIKNCTSLFQSLGEGEDINTVVNKFQSRMNHILDKYNADSVDSIRSICANLLDLLENSDKMGIKFGIKFWDDVIGGLFKGELTTIAARSGVGKTALAQYY